MVDNLGMAYGISGDLKKAKDTFEYGLSKDPKYPMFNYNMACTFAEMNDVDKAISYLQQAFQNSAGASRLAQARPVVGYKNGIHGVRGIVLDAGGLPRNQAIEANLAF